MATPIRALDLVEPDSRPFFYLPPRPDIRNVGSGSKSADQRLHHRLHEGVGASHDTIDILCV